MADFFDVAVQRVHGAGLAVTASATDWEQWSGRVRATLEEAEERVRDATVSSALAGPAGDANQAAGRLVTDVVALGSNTAGAAGDIARGDLDAVEAVRPALATDSALPVSGRLTV